MCKNVSSAPLTSVFKQQIDVSVPVCDVSVALTWQIRQNMHYDPKLSAFLSF